MLFLDVRHRDQKDVTFQDRNPQMNYPRNGFFFES